MKELRKPCIGEKQRAETAKQTLKEFNKLRSRTGRGEEESCGKNLATTENCEISNVQMQMIQHHPVCYCYHQLCVISIVISIHKTGGKGNSKRNTNQAPRSFHFHTVTNFIHHAICLV